MTAPNWAAARYPITTTCPFCGNTLTTGHAHDCIQNPNRTRQQRQSRGAA